MVVPTILMGIIAAILFVMVFAKGDGRYMQGLEFSFRMLLQMLPLLIFAMIIAGMVQILLPPELIGKWVGTESGIRGVFIGTAAGALTPGGPYVCMPITAGLLKAGAGTGTMVAFLTSWSLISIARLPMEIGFLGIRFTIIRYLCVFFFPPIAGLLAAFISK